MKIFYSDTFVLPLPPGHRFPMQKYALLRERVLASGIVPPADLAIPEPASDAELARAHYADYIARVQAGALSAQEVRRIGFPWSSGIVERSRRCRATMVLPRRAARWLCGEPGRRHAPRLRRSRRGLLRVQR